MVARPPPAGVHGAISLDPHRSQTIGDRAKRKAAARRAHRLDRDRRRTTDIDAIAAVLGADFSRLRAASVAAAASLTNPDGLLALPLIHKGDNAIGDWSWPSWFKRLGLPKSSAAAGTLTLDDMGLCMSAAADGAGVTLGRSLLVADAMSSGRLMPALANSPTVECTKMYVAQWPANLIGDRSVELFVNWLAEQAETTIKTLSAA